MESSSNDRHFNPADFCITDPVTDSNCYGIIRDGCGMIIDPNDYGQLKPLLQKWNTDLLLVFLTHEHCDHISALNALRRDFSPVVISSHACSEAMQNSRENMSRMMEMFLFYKSKETKMTPYAPFTCSPAEVQFSEEILFPFGGSMVRVKPLPGHTHGSCVISYEGILYSGDYLLPGERVLTRLPGGSEEEYENDARPWLGKIPDGVWICPGHGEKFQMCREVRQFHDL